METIEEIRPQIRSSGRRTPLAWRNIVHNKVTLLISTAAVAFAVVIMFMELGFLNGLHDSQTGALQVLRADLVMVSRALHIFNTHETFPRSRLEQAAGFDGVKGAYPVYIEDRLSDLRNPRTGIKNGIRVLGFDVGNPVFQPREITRLTDRLRAPMTILFDQKSRSFFGPLQTGTRTELADRAVTVAGTFELGPDYYYDGNVLTSAETFFTLFPNQRRSEVFIGIIQLAEGATRGAVLRDLRGAMGPDVEVMTKAEIIAREKATWQKSTPAGYIFTMGVAVGFVIGVFICYQILYTDISDHLPQLATLKALGYQNRDLVRLVLTQAVLLGMLGFVPAVAMTLGLYSILTAVTGIVTKLTLARVALVFVLTLGMCFVAGLLAVRKALAADPAELF
jgi:putative ABC transport system permease protein